jgi:hypothetical protein
MRSAPPLLRLAACAALALGLATPRVVDAAPETYIFLVSRVDLAAKGMPRPLADAVKAELAKAIDAHPELDGALPAGAPDPERAPDAFTAYLARRKQRAFKVNVEITDYASEIEERAGRDRVLTVRVALKLFGETMPVRVMAFTGDGTATIKIEIGKTLRDKDRTYADQQALELAVSDAIKTSIERLREPPPSQAKGKGKGKGKKAKP